MSLLLPFPAFRRGRRLIQLFAGIGLVRVPIPIALFFVNIRVPAPVFANGTLWLLSGFLLMNLLVLLEVADRLTLKNDLEIARQIQQAMLPRGAFQSAGVEAFGMTRPANLLGTLRIETGFSAAPPRRRRPSPRRSAAM